MAPLREYKRCSHVVTRKDNRGSKFLQKKDKALKMDKSSISFVDLDMSVISRHN